METSIGDMKEKCHKAEIVSALMIMVQEKKTIEIELRRDIKKDADMVAGLKQTQLQQKHVLDDLIARVDAMKTATKEMTDSL